MGNDESGMAGDGAAGAQPRRKTSHVLGSVIALLLLAALAGVSWWLTHAGKPVVAGAFGGGPGGSGGPGGGGAASAPGAAASSGFRTSRIAADSDAGGRAASGSDGSNLVAGGPAHTPDPSGAPSLGGASGNTAGRGGPAGTAAGGTGAGGSAPGGSAPGGAPAGRRGAPATTVGVATATRADLPVVLEALGTVTPVANVTVRPQVSGVIRRIEFTEGQMVKAGQLLATIEPAAFDIALQQARGQLARDQAALEDARVSLSRYDTLLRQDSIARQTVDTQAALVKQLQGTVMTDQAAVASAQLNLNYTRITSPVSGKVGLRVIDQGNYIGAGDTTGVAVVTQMAPIDVVFSVPQDQVPAIQQRVGTGKGAAIPATALDRSRVNTLDTGVFLTLDNRIDTTTGTVKAKARFANAQGNLFPSQFVNLRLTVRTDPGAVVVPIAAVRHGNNGDFVYVLNPAESTVSIRPVTRGQATDDRIAIASGLALGEQVITEGADRLTDGARVQLPSRAASAPGRAASGPRGSGRRREQAAQP